MGTNTDNSNINNDQEISLKKYFNIILKEKNLIIILTLIASVFGGTYSLFKKPLWSGEFEMLIQNNNDTYKPLGNKISSSINPLAGLNRTVENKTKLEILKSRSVLGPVYDFVKENDPNMELNFKKWLNDKTNIKIKLGTDILSVEYKDHDKKLILSSLLQIKEQFQNYSISQRKKELSQSIIYLNSQKQKLSERYKKSLAKFNKFSLENSLGNVDGFISLENRNDSNTSNSTNFSNQINTPLANNARQRYAMQFQMLETYETKFENLSSRLKPTSQTLINLKIDIENLKEALKRPNQILIKYKELQSTVKGNQELLDNVINSLEITKLSQARQLVPWDIITPPTINELRISPKRKQIVFTAFLSSLIFSFVIAIIKSKKKGLIFEKEDFEKLLSITFNDCINKNDLTLNTLLIKKLITNKKDLNNLAILELNEGKNETSKYFLDDITATYISLDKIEELEKFINIVVLANPGKINLKNLNIAFQYLKIYKDKIKGYFFLEDL